MTHNDAIYRTYLLGVICSNECCADVKVNKMPMTDLIAYTMGYKQPFEEQLKTRQQVLDEVERVLGHA